MTGSDHEDDSGPESMPAVHALLRMAGGGRREIAVMVLHVSGLVVVSLGAVLAAQLVGATEYGRFNTAGAFITIAAAAVAAGHAERAMRVGALTHADDHDRTRRANAVARHLLIAAPVAILVVLPVGLISRASVWVVLVVCVPIAVLLAAAQTFEAFARGAFHSLRDLLPVRLVHPLLFTAGCAVFLLVDSNINFVELLVFRLAVLALVVMWYARRLRLRLRQGPERTGPALEPLGSFTTAKVLYITQAQSSILLAGLISAKSAGLYAAALRSATLIAAAMAALAMLAGPVIASAAHRDDLASVAPRLRSYARLGFVLAFVPAVVMLAWPDVVLGFFGDEFRSAADALRILAGAQLVLTLFGASDMFATLAKQERSVAFWTAVAAALQIGVALLLVALDALTITRLAAIDAVGTVTWNVGLWWSCRRRVGATAAAF